MNSCPESKTLDSQEIAVKLRTVGMKITPTRTAILECLSASEKPLTIDEILEKINQSRGRSHVWSTVFRCLEKCLDSNLVNAVRLGDSYARYELRHGDHHHHHIVCRVCQSIEPIEECALLELENGLQSKGYQGLSHRLEFFGTCPKCVH